MKRYKSLISEVSVPQELVNSKIDELSPELVEFFRTEIESLLDPMNGRHHPGGMYTTKYQATYSKNLYKVVQALYQMDVVQGLKPKLSLLFIKHFFNYFLNRDKYIMTPTTLISTVIWETVKSGDTSFLFYKIASSEIDSGIDRFYQELGSDFNDVGGGFPFDPEYASMEDWEEHYADYILDYVEPDYIGIIPTTKGFELTYIGAYNNNIESIINAKLLPFLTKGMMNSYNFFNMKAVLKFFDTTIQSNKASLTTWLKR
jgi:hypothetical protein